MQTADPAALELTLTRTRAIQGVKHGERNRPIRIRAYAVEWWDGAQWVQLFTGEQEADHVVRFPPVTTSRIRIRVLHMEHTVTVAEIVIEDVVD